MDEFLEPYEDTLTDLDPALERLDTLVGDESAHAERLRRVRGTADQCLDGLAGQLQRADETTVLQEPELGTDAEATREILAVFIPAAGMIGVLGLLRRSPGRQPALLIGFRVDRPGFM